MPFTTTEGERFSIIRVDGPLDAAAAALLKAELSRLAQQGATRMLLDLSGCPAADPTGLSALLVGHRLCRGAKGRFVVCGVAGDLARMLTLVQLDSVLCVAADLAAAQRALEGDQG